MADMPMSLDGTRWEDAIIHQLPARRWDVTHVREGHWTIDREAREIRVMIQPLIAVVDDGVVVDFEPHPAIEWQRRVIGPDRWDDYVAYCETWDAEGRPRATTPLSCALEYLSLVDMGLRPLESEEEE